MLLLLTGMYTICQPLTDTGRNQARALARTGKLPTNPDRIYSSDLSRALETAKIAAIASSANILIDKRLREKAFGAREGFPRSLDYEEAVRLRQEQGLPVPSFVETNDDVWFRAHEWLNQVLREVISNMSFTNDNEKRTVEILAFTHAGFIRQILFHLLGDARVRAHPNAKFDPKQETRLLVPNTSVAVIDLVLPSSATNQEFVPKEDSDMGDKAQLIEMNWAEHLTLVGDDLDRLNAD